MDLTNAWNDNASFWWANGQRLLSYSTKDSGDLSGRQSPFKKGSRTPFLDLLPHSSAAHASTRSSQTHAYRYAISPASYVDDVEPFASPCSPDGVLASNLTETNCKVHVFHHLYSL